MTTRWRWIPPSLRILLALLVVLAGLWTYGRLSSPTAAQREALALMQARTPLPEGENGFELLMALPAVSNEDVQALPACDHDASCIDAMQAAPARVSAAIATLRPWLEANARALRAPTFRDRRTTASLADSLPADRGMVRLQVLRAFDFAAGQTAAALEATCEDARGAIRRAGNPDSLAEGTLGIAIFRQQAALIADMRRRAPRDPLPSSCMALAVAPDPIAEGTLCPALRGEWFLLTRMTNDLKVLLADHAPAWSLPVLHDPGWILAHAAETYAPHCRPAASTAVREDRVLEPSAVEPRWVDYVSSPISVIHEVITDPPLDVAERQLDFVAQRRLLAALLQMDAMPATMGNAERFAALPETLREGPRALRMEGNGRAVSVAVRSSHEAHEGGIFRLPQPERLPSARGDSDGQR